MRIKRFSIDFYKNLPLQANGTSQLPTVRLLLGPRQSGKTTLLDQLGTHELISLDDYSIREEARKNPALFLDQFKRPIILDEATNSPELFFEIKKRVDEAKRAHLKNEPYKSFDYWITGSNQTLMSKRVQESLAGRVDIYHLNTLSLEETKDDTLETITIRGGWPELHADKSKDARSYLNGLIATFIEKDIVLAAGIERSGAFAKATQLFAGIIGEMINYSELASIIGVESPTVSSWAHILEQNQLIKIVPPYLNNLNKRLTKMPKLYFEDVALAIRLQGWSEYHPLYVSPYMGHVIENIAYSELSRFMTNNQLENRIYYIRNKEKVEIDFLLELPNKRFISAEVKTTPRNYTGEQLKLLDSLKINIVEKWIITPLETSHPFENVKIVPFKNIARELRRVVKDN